MRAFFSFPKRRIGLKKRAAAWLRTPFVEHGRIRGAGVDCANLVAELLKESGVEGEFNLPQYAMDGGKNNETSQVLLWLESDRRFYCVWHRDGVDPSPLPYSPALALAGDVLVFNLRSRSAHHAGLMITGEKFIHALFNHGVVMANLKDSTHRSTLVAVYRPLEDVQ